MPDRLVFFTTDEGFLIPTLHAAMQVVSRIGAKGFADVAVFLVDVAAQETSRLAAEFPQIGFLNLDSGSFSLPPDADFNATHVPRSTLARLSSGPLIPRRYEHVLYLDGDIAVVGDIEPLVLATAPPGRVLAAPDHAELAVAEMGRYAAGYRRYLKGLGLSSAGDYFNAGVLAARRATWIEMGAAALAYISRHSTACRFHDQSALNAVMVGKREYLSPRYNLTSWPQALGAASHMDAAILHFTGGAKPWADFGAALQGKMRPEYEAFMRQHPVLDAYWPRTAGRNAQGEGLRRRFTLEDLVFWRRFSRRRRLGSILKRNAALA